MERDDPEVQQVGALRATRKPPSPVRATSWGTPQLTGNIFFAFLSETWSAKLPAPGKCFGLSGILPPFLLVLETLEHRPWCLGPWKQRYV